MLITSTRLHHTPIMSLQTGGQIGRTADAIIDPATLEILAYLVEGPLVSSNPTYLRIADIRELSDIGFIIDSADEFVIPGDVIQLDNVVKYQFSLQNMPVTNEERRRLGKVIDYSIDIDSFTVTQLIIKRTLLHSFNDTELVVHRSQIIEINDKAIVIKEDAEIPEHTRVTTPGSYVNPFRGAKPAADAIDQSSS